METGVPVSQNVKRLSAKRVSAQEPASMASTQTSPPLPTQNSVRPADELLVVLCVRGSALTFWERLRWG